MDLVEFLRARLNATEQKARDLHRRTCGHDDVSPDAPCNCDWHVSWVLREVEAKRRIVDSFAAAEQPLTTRTAEFAVVRMVLRLLALPYADHPDYGQDWNPASAPIVD